MGKIKKIGKKLLSSIGMAFPNFYAKLLFLVRTHRWPNLKNPRTFNEKTTWIKLNNYNKNLMVSKCADKYSVRKYVESRGCGEILNTLYGVYKNFDEIDFKKLPRQFVLKCVHGCAYNIIIKDKQSFDIKNARKKVQSWQKEKYGYASAELHYTKIEPKIIVEKYLCDENGKMPLDYKFYCFGGHVGCILVCSERDEALRLSYYDKNWKRLPFEKKSWSSQKNIEKPQSLKRMIDYAEKLAGDFPFVRVDLYNDKGNIIFGELTFTPACSCAPYYSKKGNEELGKMLQKFRHDDIKKICMVGHLASGIEQFDGQTIKTRLIFEQLKSKYGEENISFVDTYGWEKKPIKLYNKCREVSRKNSHILIMPASRGARIFVPLFVMLKKKYGFKLHYVLIGGRIYEVARKNSFLRKNMKKIDYIYAENYGVIKKLNDLDIKNVYYMPNFKVLKKASRKKKISANGVHCCIFSRVEKEKGVIDAMEVVDKYNTTHNNKIHLDIYGKIRDDFASEFKRIAAEKNFVEYKGVVNPEDSVRIIKEYDLLLFPTKYKTEGIPGTIIDAYFAGTPVLASKWENFKEIIVENKTGFGYKFDDNEDFYNKLEEVVRSKKKLAKLRENCLAASSHYSPKNAMHNLTSNIDRELAE